MEEAVQQLRIAAELLADENLDHDPAKLELRSSLYLILGDYSESLGKRNQARQEWEKAQTGGMYGLTLIGQQVAQQRLASHPAEVISPPKQ